MVITMTREEIITAIYTDILTGIWNRSAFEVSPTSPFIAIVDLDSLKWVNDNAGHRTGDVLLTHVARTIQKMFGDSAFRLSGDEFVVRGDSVEALARLLNTKDRIFSFGVGEDLETADFNLRLDKDYRESIGTRAGRGEKPAFSNTLDLLTLGSKDG